MKTRCHVLFAYNIGDGLDLALADRRLRQEGRRRRIKHTRRAPPEQGLRPKPLQITWSRDPVRIDHFATAPFITINLYEVGAACIHYTLDLEASMSELAHLSELLYDHEILLDSSRHVAAAVTEMLGDAVERAELSALVEDYVIFELQWDQGKPVEHLWNEDIDVLARVLRPESYDLSEQEVTDALTQRISYGREDVAIIDWYASILAGKDLDDERMVIEFGVVELLQLRLLDWRLDRNVEQAYHLLQQSGHWAKLFRVRSEDLAQVSELQMDGAMLFEGVHNAFKLVGDQYLARMYRAVSFRFHLPAWERAVERKLSVLEGIYSKLSDQANHVRFEVLEWIIIILIAISIGVYFIPGVG